MAKLYETITAENWAKQLNRKGPTCVGMHLYRTYRRRQIAFAHMRRLRDAAIVLFPDRMEEPFPDRMEEPSLWPFVAVGAFNDHPDTTFEDVLRVCKLAGV